MAFLQNNNVGMQHTKGQTEQNLLAIVGSNTQRHKLQQTATAALDAVRGHTRADPMSLVRDLHTELFALQKDATQLTKAVVWLQEWANMAQQQPAWFQQQQPTFHPGAPPPQPQQQQQQQQHPQTIKQVTKQSKKAPKSPRQAVVMPTGEVLQPPPNSGCHAFKAEIRPLLVSEGFTLGSDIMSEGSKRWNALGKSGQQIYVDKVNTAKKAYDAAVAMPGSRKVPSEKTLKEVEKAQEEKERRDAAKEAKKKQQQQQQQQQQPTTQTPAIQVQPRVVNDSPVPFSAFTASPVPTTAKSSSSSSQTPFSSTQYNSSSLNVFGDH